jgi:hypothetical protein
MDIIQKPLSNYKDERGVIETIADANFASVLKITSVLGSKRANHWHREDYHYCFLESGEIYYYERPVTSLEKPTLTIIQPGQVFYTGPKIEHQMYFSKDSVFWCFSKLSRAQENYEADTIRLEFDLKEKYEK